LPSRTSPRPPRAHWLLLSALLVTVSGLLTLHIFVSGQVGGEQSAPNGETGHVPPAARSGGSVVDSRGPTVRRLPDHTVALSFADGPDPRWTPAILGVLAKYHVHATFFVTGARAAANPGVIRQILAAGQEIGNRTATRTDLRHASDTQVELELQATDLALAGAAGITTNLVELPYVSPVSLDDPAWDAAVRVGNHGRLVTLADLDSQDWLHPGVQQVVANSTPRTDQGAIALLHDSNPETVDAVDRLIPALQSAGWKIDSIGAATNIPESSNPAGIRDRISGLLLLGAVAASTWLATALQTLLVVAAVLAATRTALVLIATPFHVRRVRSWRPPFPISQRISVIIPAYNEEAGIAGTVRSVLDSHHPVEAIVVDDGSTDRTAEAVRAMQRWSPYVRLLRQDNAGKSAALNTGLAAARSNLVVIVDGDTVIEPNAVGMLVDHFTDPTIGAVSGNAKVGNRKGFLGRWQHIEYVIGFNLDRRMYDVFRCMPTVPGAIGAFRRAAVEGAGGVSADTLAEDTDLTMALERLGWRVVYEEHARAWTEAPATLGQLWKQRYRWCYGTLQATWKHRHAALESGAAGRLGRRGIPYLLLFQVALQVVSPVVDVAGVFSLFTQDAVVMALTWLGFVLLQAVPGLIAFRLDGEQPGPLLLLPLQQIVYRQLMYLVVVQSVVTALAGARLPWHKLQRRGEANPLSAAPTRHKSRSRR
jgi:cellulose synthase/poly-beta-1,6-N-acetylglucosamine synthase-like glycosyltransferase/peptidoglycan/xylan/chitin deacetylase (PgdA/CDA1 family)